VVLSISVAGDGCPLASPRVLVDRVLRAFPVQHAPVLPEVLEELELLHSRAPYPVAPSSSSCCLRSMARMSPTISAL
jgi:hypothetical protein